MANAYQAEQSEAWLGEWMTLHKNHDEVVLATKYSLAYMAHKKGKLQPNYIGNDIKSLWLSSEASLKKLQTSYIDIVCLY